MSPLAVLAPTWRRVGPPAEPDPPSELWPNLPDGYTTFNEQPWNVDIDYPSGSEGWVNDNHVGGSPFGGILTDPTAPSGGEYKIAAGLFPEDAEGGSAPFYVYRPFATGEQYKNLYIGLYCKHSPDWANNGIPANRVTGTKFLWPAGDQVGGTMLYTSFDNTDYDNSMAFALIQQGTVDRFLGANQGAGAIAAATMGNFLGDWNLYEILLKSNTSDASADGQFDCWINGTHTHHYTDVQYIMAAARKWLSLAWNPTYGGSEHEAPAVPADQYESIDIILLAGSNS